MDIVKIAVIGLGYVGLPLARLFSTKYKTVGFDMNKSRVDALMAGHDATLEVSDELLQSAIANGFKCTADIEDIRDCNFYIVAVPTPVDHNHNPDLTPLYSASTTVGKVISKGDIVVYESTVYPGVTEDECIPVVEKISGLEFNTDFFAGYSPERINPGDKLHTVEKIKKVTSGSTPEIGKKVNEVYASVISAGTHLAPTMKVAEAAKVIENSQRDINIAFVNELSKIFTRMGIDTQDVLEAASTKWNFLPFKPGLVGGHCIGVDPYYLAQCAQSYGYNPEIILAGRRMNDGMGEYVAGQVIKLMLKKGIQVLNSNILILGFTFKENCPDVRNTKVIDIYEALMGYNLNITVYDPWANPDIVKHEYGIESVAHLSCISSTKEDIKYECERLKEAGIDNILALRGDYPADATNFDPENLEFHYASELNEFIGEHFKGQFCLSGACYPETHQEADGFKKDLEALKKKVDAGAEYLVTQIFFDNDYYYRLVREARKIGITVPILAGIMPITNAKSLIRTTKMCGCTIPYQLSTMIEAHYDNPEAMKEIGINYAAQQIIDLITNGVDGIHIYTMNRAETAQRVFDSIPAVLKELN